MNFSSAEFWEDRYANGGNSGAGSYGDSAVAKAAFVNQFVRNHGIFTVIEYGCGDGNQLALADYEVYRGIDVSEEAIRLCRARFKGDRRKIFEVYDPRIRHGMIELALSLDVLYHLVEDEVYDRYLQDLFGASNQWVIAYTSDLNRGACNEGLSAHMRHRTIEADVADGFPDWRLFSVCEGLDGCWFYVWQHK